MGSIAHAGNKGGITFENMGYDVMYLPGYFINERNTTRKLSVFVRF